MKYLMNWKIGTRILVGFLVVVALTAVAGITGIVNIGTIGNAVEKISYDEAPLVDAANEMKISLAMGRNAMEEYKGATSTMASDDKSMIRDIEEAFKQTVADFDVFADAILEGGNTEAGEVRATDNDELRRLVEEADRLHNEKFQKATADLFAVGKDLLQQKTVVNENMEKMESLFDEITADASEVEDAVKETIAAKKKNLSSDAKRILERDVPLTDMAMEIKTTLAVSRIKLEEINQMTDESSIRELQDEYAQTIEDFDLWVTAILEGAETDEGLVYAATDNKVLSQVKELDENHEDFQTAADELIQGQLEMIRLTAVANEAMERLDKYGAEVAGLLDKVEKESSNEMDAAVASADSAQTTANATLISVTLIAVLLGVFIGVFISGSITKPINKMVSALKKLGQNDLTATVDIDSNDEVGIMAKSFNTAVKNVSEMVNQVKESAEQVSSASEQISASSEELASGAEEQQSQTSEVATSIEQMTATILDSSQNANKALESSQKATAAATTGGDVVEQTVSGMARISDAVRASSDQIEELGKRSEEIGKIIGVIDDIADQTNLLALNANIEAARAGEQGRGFAVVADEVRVLAERTTKATAEIAEMIKGIQDGTNSAVEAMNEGMQEVDKGVESAEAAGKSLNEIITVVQDVQTGINQIAASTEEQSSGAEQISANVEGISTVTKQSAGSAQQVASAAQQLSQETDDLNKLVSQFKL